MGLRIYGNRSLKTLAGKDTRPTANRVREAVFHIWQGTIEGCRWLDLCTGSGAMGAEALCRGAALVIGIEQSARACALIRQNWQQVVQPHQAFQLFQGDVVKRIRLLEGQLFDHIYFDPPYASQVYQPVLSAIAQLRLLAPTGELAVEHASDRTDWLIPETLTLVRRKVYGNTAVTFYQVRTSSSARD